MATANEYKLSFTGTEINEKLSKIDTLETKVNELSGRDVDLTGYATEEYVNTAIANNAQYAASILAHNTDSSAHADIRADIATLEEQSNLIFTNWFVDELEANGDITKKYVLADNYIYLYNSSEGNITNLADPKSSEWLNGKRVNSSKEVIDVSDINQRLTNIIPLGGDNKFHIKGLNVYDATIGEQNYCRVVIYDSSKTILGFAQLNAANFKNCYSIADYDNNVSIVDVSMVIDVLARTYAIDGATYVRFGGYTTDPDSVIITIDENIPAKIYESNTWVNTGLTFYSEDDENIISELSERINVLESNDGGDITIPSYWKDYLDDKITTIKALQDAGGRSCISFVVMTDMHHSSNLGKCAPALARKIMDACGIKYALVLGDTQSRGSWKTKAEAEDEFNAVDKMLAPIADRMLRTQGNHDGSWGTALNGVSYPYNYTPEEMYNRIYRKSQMLDGVHVDETGTGYYVDDNATKMRYIVLNSHCNKHVLNDDGSAKYNNMSTFRFTQSQYDLVVDALTNMPNGYNVAVFAHAPINSQYESHFGGSNGTQKVMRDLLSAYKNKTAYSGSFSGTGSGGDEDSGGGGSDGSDDTNTSYTNLAGTITTNYRLSSSGALKESSGAAVTDYIPITMGDIVRVKGLTMNTNLPDSNSACIAVYSDNTGTCNAVFYPNSHTAAFVEQDGIMTWTAFMTGNASASQSGDFTAGTKYYIRICGTPVSGEDIIVTVNESIEDNSGDNGSGSELACTNLADPASSEWLIGYRINSSKAEVSCADTRQHLTNIIPLGGSNKFHVKGMNVYDALATDGSNYNRVIIYDSNKTVLGFGQLSAANFSTYYSVASYDDSVSIVDVAGVITKLGVSGATYVRFGGQTTNKNTVVIARDEQIIEKSMVVTFVAKASADNPYDAVTVDVDFTSAKGEFIGYFSGHMHGDNVYNQAHGFGFNIITTRCDAMEENGDALKTERIIGTTTEQSFDVFTVNTKEHKIYATKIGAGNDRVINY